MSQADLESDPLPAQDYDLIVMMRYVNHALAPMLASRLAQGGYFVCEQHLVTNEDVTGPSGPPMGTNIALQQENFLNDCNCAIVLQ